MFEFGGEPAQGGVAHAFAVASHHAGHVQILDAYRLGITYEAEDLFVLVVGKLVTGFRMQFGESLSCFAVPVGAFLFSGQVTLRVFDAPFRMRVVAWVGDMVPSALRGDDGRQCGEPEIYRRVRFGWRQWGGGAFRHEADVPSSVRLVDKCA